MLPIITNTTTLKPTVYLIVILNLLFGCKKNSNDKTNAPALTFQITEQKRVIYNFYNSVQITWSIPIGVTNTDDVKYVVSLNGVTIDTVRNNSYIFQNVLATLTYQGQITAIVKGQIQKLDFKLEEEKGFIYANLFLPFGEKKFTCYRLTGEKVWSKTRSNSDNGITADAICASNDTIFIYNIYDKGVYALNAKTGATYWFQKSNFNEGTLLFFNYCMGILYARYDNLLIAFNASNGKQVWTKDVGAGFYHIVDIGVENDVLLVKSTSDLSRDRNKLVAYNAKTGEQMWRHEEGEGYDYLGPLHIHNGTVYALYSYKVDEHSNYGVRLYAFNTATGAKRTLYNLSTSGSYRLINPYVLGNTVFVCTAYEYGLNQLFAINKDTGAKLWGVPIESKGFIANYNLFSDGTNLFLRWGGNNKTITKFDAKTGNKLWSAYVESVAITPDNLYSINDRNHNIESIYAIDNLSGRLNENTKPNIESKGEMLLRINNSNFQINRIGALSVF